MIPKLVELLKAA
jgi:hypothetical protein